MINKDWIKQYVFFVKCTAYLEKKSKFYGIFVPFVRRMKLLAEMYFIQKKHWFFYMEKETNKNF